MKIERKGFPLLIIALSVCLVIFPLLLHFMPMKVFAWASDRKLQLLVANISLATLILFVSLTLVYAERPPLSSNDSSEKRNGIVQVFVGKVPDKSTSPTLSGSLAEIIRTAAGTNQIIDVSDLKARILAISETNSPKVLMVTISSPPAGAALLLGKLCKQMDADCMVLVPDSKDASSDINSPLPTVIFRDREQLANRLREIDGENLVRADTVLFVFSPSGKLLWFSDSADANSLRELELVLRIVAILGYERLPVKPSLSSEPVKDLSVPSSDKPVEVADLNHVLYALSNGAATKLSDVRSLREGMPTVVNFWATWCPPCLFELPEIQRISQEFSDRVSFVGVVIHSNNPQERMKTHQLLSQKGATFAQYVVTDPSLIRQLQGLDSDIHPVYPYFVVFDGKGRIKARIIGALSEEKNRDRLLSVIAEAE